MISPIQVILSAGVLILGVVFFSKLPSRFLIRLTVTIVLLSTLVIIFFPELSTRIANMLGVGRGTDLIVYLGFVNLLFLYLILYIKYRRIKEKLTEVVREMAIWQATRKK